MYVCDTHAWIYYLLNKLPPNLNSIFSSVEKGEDIILVPTIVLNECIHLVESRKISLTYKELFSRLEESSNFLIVPLDFEITKLVPSVKLSELHDRIIVATAKYYDAVLLTKDGEIINSRVVKTVWN